MIGTGEQHLASLDNGRQMWCLREKVKDVRSQSFIQDIIRSSAIDYTGAYHQIANIHGDGSLAARRMFLYMSADWTKCKAAARRVAHIDGWQNEPHYGPLPEPEKAVGPKLPKIDTSYKL